MALKRTSPACWFIDAWLPADGLAFVSQRQARVDVWREPKPRDGEPTGAMALTFVLRAPLFEAQSVGRAIAFGAVHRGAQEGFSIDGEHEFAFTSLDEVRHFVRRIYAGSGPGTSGGGFPVPEPWGPPEGPISPKVWQQGVDDAKDGEIHLSEPFAFADVTSAVQLLTRLESARSDWLLRAVVHLLVDSAFTTESLHGVGSGAYRPLLLAAELLDEDNFWLEQRVRAYRNGQRSVSGLNKQACTEVADMFMESYWRYDNFDRIAYLDSTSIAGARQWHLPTEWVQQLGLPPSTQTWVDLMSYMAADRSYFTLSSCEAWLPLVLAMAAPLSINNQRFRVGGARYRSRDVFLRQCWRFAAQMLPVNALGAVVEATIHQWCWRSDADAHPLNSVTINMELL